MPYSTELICSHNVRMNVRGEELNE